MKLTKKNIFVLLSIFILVLVVAFSFQHVFNASRDLATDSGFDSGFGGSSGGSSSSHDRNGNAGGLNVEGITVIFFVVALIVSIVLIFPIRVSRSKKKGKVNYRNEFISSLGYGLLVFIALILIYVIVMLICVITSSIIEKPIFSIGMFSIMVLPILFIYICTKKIYMNKMAKEDACYFKETLDDSNVVKEAYDIYVRIQEAWSKNNIEDVRNVLSDEMYNMYSSQIKTMLIKKQRNAMSDFKFVKGSINEYKNVNGQDRYVVILQVLCKDYLVDDETNRVIRGSRRRTNDYIYSLTFVKDKEVDIDKCPNCQGELSLSGQSVKCPYCGSIIERKSTNMVLVEKKMLRQR